MVQNSVQTSSSQGSLKEAISKVDEGYAQAAIGAKNIADVYNELGGDQYE